MTTKLPKHHSTGNNTVKLIKHHKKYNCFDFNVTARKKNAFIITGSEGTFWDEKCSNSHGNSSSKLKKPKSAGGKKTIAFIKSLAVSLILAPIFRLFSLTRCAAQLGGPCCSWLWSWAERRRGKTWPCRSKCGTRPCSRPTRHSWRDPRHQEWMNPSLLHKNQESTAKNRTQLEIKV